MIRKEKLVELRELFQKYSVISKTELEIGKGKFLKIGKAEYTLATGDTIVREELIKNNGNSDAAIVLPHMQNDDVIMIVQPRIATYEGVTLEFPAGYIDKGEDGITAARRELLEETGCKARKMVNLFPDNGGYYQDQGCLRAKNQSFLALDCYEYGNQKLDEDEYVSIFKCTFDEMLELYDMNYIKDANSIIAIERARRYLKR